MHARQMLYATTMPTLDQCGFVLMESTENRLARRMHGPEPMLCCLMPNLTKLTLRRLDRHQLTLSEGTPRARAFSLLER